MKIPTLIPSNLSLWALTLNLTVAPCLLSQAPPPLKPVNLQTTDYLVPHISTVPANQGKPVHLFLREKSQIRNRGGRPVVLMIGGQTVSAVPAFDLQFENYSWMEYLAAAGFDVFTMDFTGFGLSPRPMMDDPCNHLATEQQLYLVPKPIAQTCTPSYPFALTSIQSDWDEMDAVVEYIRRLRGVDKVNLIGWARGGPRAGGYTARHPEKVARLFLNGPGYLKLAPLDPPATLPLPGVPSAVVSNADLFKLWDINGGTLAPFTGMCDNQYTPAIRPVAAASMLEYDPLGSSWGTAGVRRSPVWNSPAGFNYWGWNTKVAAQVTVPTLVIRGDLDTSIPLNQIQDLLTDLVSVPQKVFVHVACSSQYLAWETQHMSLLNASVEWLEQGTYQGQFNGTFAVDKSGQIRQEN